MLQHAHDLDSDASDGTITRTCALNAIAREARAHGNHARVVRDHVLVVAPDGGTLATRSAVRLASWMGY